jgi:Zn-dependent protease
VLRGGVPLGKIFGISIRLHFSWFFIFALVTWALTTSYFPGFYPDWSLATKIVASVIASLLFFSSILAHELMHSVVAQASGIPVKSIVLFIFGGVSQIAEEPKDPKVELRIALVGPLTSILLGGIFLAIWFALPDTAEEAAAIAAWLGLVNLLLGVFNLIPGFPLDGGRVLRSILWWRTKDLRRATKTASNMGRGLGFLFIFGGIWLIFTGFWLNGLWIAFIGWFLQNAAAGSFRQLTMQQMLQGHAAREVMTRDCLTVSPEVTIEELVNEHVLPSGHLCFAVVVGSRAQGLITLQDIKAVPRELWPTRRVVEVMAPFEKLKWVPPDKDLASVLSILTQEDLHQLPVVEDGNIVGMITRDNLLSFINVRDKLGM